MFMWAPGFGLQGCQAFISHMSLYPEPSRQLRALENIPSRLEQMSCEPQNLRKGRAKEPALLRPVLRRTRQGATQKLPLAHLVFGRDWC